MISLQLNARTKLHDLNDLLASQTRIGIFEMY